MAGATGKRITFDKGTPRNEVISTLGLPKETISQIDNNIKKRISGSTQLIAYADIHSYRGKVNAVDEGGAQATVNAFTLGTSEAVMIPLTVYDIARRSVQLHEIFAVYNQNDRLEGILIDPRTR